MVIGLSCGTNLQLGQRASRSGRLSRGAEGRGRIGFRFPLAGSRCVRHAVGQPDHRNSKVRAEGSRLGILLEIPGDPSGGDRKTQLFALTLRLCGMAISRRNRQLFDLFGGERGTRTLDLGIMRPKHR
jgi:hypothetical protein